jgi:hypothetical protein
VILDDHFRDITKMIALAKGAKESQKLPKDSE